jgi:hypothetical protein
MQPAPRIWLSVLSAILLLAPLALGGRSDEPENKRPARAPAPVGRPRTVTLHRKVALGQALKDLAAQTGVTVEDGRRNKSDDPELKLDLDNATFWQALDVLAKEADVRVDLNKGDKIVLVDGPNRAVPVSYSGIFRVAVVSLETVEDFESGAHLLRARLQVAWEPQFKPLFLDVKTQSMEAKDDTGNALEPFAEGAGRTAVRRSLRTTVDVLLNAPRRAAAKLGVVKGELSLLGPSRTLRFTLDKLVKSEDGKPVQTQTQDGVAATLRDFKVEDGTPPRWTASFHLKYPPEGMNVDSDEVGNWVLNSRIFLVKKDDPKVTVSTEDYELDEQGAAEVGISYTFGEVKGGKLGKPSQWKLVYELPGPMIRLPARFEFKDLRLP